MYIRVLHIQLYPGVKHLRNIYAYLYEQSVREMSEDEFVHSLLKNFIELEAIYEWNSTWALEGCG